MKMKSQWLPYTRLGLIGAIAFAGATGQAVTVNAAEANTSSAQQGQADDMEQIVVTVRKRAEKMQDIPESVAVINSTQIENSNVTGLRSFVTLIPNLIVRESFRSGETFLTMRGLSSAQGALPPVAFVVDGVQAGSNDFISQDLFDVESIQILRGPQGALYGQGAIAGAIDIVTKQPTNDLSVYANATYGNANSLRAAGSISGPLVKDMLFAKVGGYYKRSDGLIKNNAGQRITPYDEGYGRGQLNYKNENLKIYLRGSYLSGKGYCCIQDIAQKQDNLTGVIYPGWQTPPNPYTVINTDQVAGSPGPTSNVLGRTWNRSSDAALKIDYDFSAFTLTSISGFAYNRQHVYGDADYTAAGPTQLLQDIIYSTRVFNQEARLTSHNNEKFNWILGGFYQYRKHEEAINAGIDPGAPLDETPGNISTFVLRQDNVTKSHSYAFFGSGAYNITKDLELDLALRYDHDSQNNVNNGIPPGVPSAATFHAVQPKAELAYHWTSDMLLYVTYSQGFRSGGYSQNVKFANETTKNYEFGMKSTLMDGKATINASFFHTDYANQQISFVQLQPVVLKQVINIPSTSIDGMEFELAARPTDNLTLQIGAGVTNSVIKKASANTLTTGLNLAALIGNKSPLVSPITLNASINYVLPLANDFAILFHTDWRREGGYYFDINNAIKTGTHDLVSGKIDLQKNDWSIGVWGQNLTDARYTTNVGVTGTPYRYPNLPRSYGVEATFKF